MEKPIFLLKLKQHFYQKKAIISRSSLKGDAGYTLIELLIVIIIIGVLAAAAAPGWLSFISQRRVTAANEFVLRALQEAQNQAKSKKLSYTVSFRTQDGVPEVAVYQTKKSDGSNLDPYNWKSLKTELGLQQGQVLLGTNLTEENKKQNNINYTLDATKNKITFDYLGALPTGADTGLAIVVAAGKDGNAIDSTKRCVKVETLLGGLKTGRGKYDATSNPEGCP
jgi:prepilin-type N-terminal cleavage/methylation domain-containing protein